MFMLFSRYNEIIEEARPGDSGDKSFTTIDLVLKEVLMWGRYLFGSLVYIFI